MTRRRAPWLAATIMLGCGPRACDGAREPVHAEDAEAPPPPADAAAPNRAVVLDAVDPKADCTLGFKGPVIDLGSQRNAAIFGARLTPPPVDWIERDGSRWAEVRGKTLSVDFFVLPTADQADDNPPGATPYLDARIRGGVARSVSYYLNNLPVGSATLTRGAATTLVFRGSAAQPAPGNNELVLRFSGLPKGATDASADVDWIHFGTGEPDAQYPAPRWRDALVGRNLGGQPGRAASLRGPGFMRCEGWLPEGGVVETRARIEGTGSADAQVLVVRDRAAPTVIGTLHLEATEHPDERLRSWPLGDVGGRGTLGAIEWAIVRASRGARVILEGPAVLGPEAAKGADHAKRPSARGVVVVVMSQLGPRSLSPYGGSMATPTLSALASTGTVFDANRATTGVASGAVASMLTGLPARELGMTDATTRLPHGATTVADAARQAGIASAMFTANPLSSSAFGFDRSWSHFEAHGPKEEGPSARVFDAAATWLEEQGSGSFLLVVHARGAHPPWDVTAERQKALPPASYAGGLDPHHAGELLGRSVRASGTGRFDDADSARAWALCGAAMESEDAGLAKLLGTLKALGREETTTVIVTGDVGLDDRGRVLLTESDSVEDAALATPLIVRWARTPARGDHVASATSGEDVATTMLAAFGLSPPDSFRGRDLWTMASGSDSSAPRPSLAMAEDRFSLRWGSFVSSGVRDHETKLCDVTLEPACVTDVRDGYPIASRLLHAVLYDDLVARKPSFDREAAALDAAALADLKVWGR